MICAPFMVLAACLRGYGVQYLVDKAPLGAWQRIGRTELTVDEWGRTSLIRGGSDRILGIDTAWHLP